MESKKMMKKVAGFFAKKGEKKLAAHERREAAGKEKDTPAMAKREMKALKGAPAGLKNYEKKEHKAKGMKKGGMSGCYAEGGMVKKMAMGGMAPPAGPVKGPPAGIAPDAYAPPEGTNFGPPDKTLYLTPYHTPAQQEIKREMRRTNSSPQQEMRGMRGQRGYAKGGAVRKPENPTPGDLNEIAGGDQEMQMREDIAAKNRMRGPGRGPLSRNAMKDKPFGYAKGGMVRADGCASKGKTKGRFV